MRQVIKHRDIRLLNMIRRTDPCDSMTTTGGVLIDHDGTIIAVPNSVEELKAKLEEIFPNNK